MTELNIGALTDSTSYTGSVDTTNIFDLYKFNINSPGSFKFTIDGLSGNADVFLLNSSGAPLYSSTNAGTEAERISADSLVAGDYSLKVKASQISGDMTYTLNLAPTSTQKSSDADTLIGAQSDSPLPSNSAETSEKPTANIDVITGTPVDEKTVTAETTSTTTDKPVTTDSETTLTSEPEPPVATTESAAEITSTTTENSVTTDSETTLTSEPEPPVATTESATETSTTPDKPVTTDSETNLTSEPEKPVATTESATETSTTPDKPVTTDSETTLTSEPEKPVATSESASEKLPSEETTSPPDKPPTDSAISTAEKPSETVATNNLNSTTATKTDAVAGETVATQEQKTGETLVAISPDSSKPRDETNTDTSNGEETKKENSTTTVATTETKKEPEPTTDKKLISPFTSGVFTTDETGRISVDYTFDGGRFQGELAIFSLDDLDKFEPGSEAFIKEVAARSLSNSVKGHVVINDATEGARFSGFLGENNANEGVYLGVKSFAVTPGGKYGVMLVPNGSVKFVYDNPTVGGDQRPLFSMAMANPVEGFHFGQIADVTGEGNTFVMEDMRLDSGTDRDYNDLIFQVRGATATTALVDSVINPDKEWRKTDLGKALIAYAKPYITPEPKPNVDAELSDLLDDLETEILNPSTSDIETPQTPAPATTTDEDTTDATQVETTDKVDAKPTTPAVTTEEEVKDTANNSGDSTQVETTDKVDAKPTTPAVTTEEEVKDTANNSGDSTQVETTDTIDTKPTTPSVTTEEEVKDTANNFGDSTKVETTDQVDKKPTTPAVTTEEEVKDTANNSGDYTQLEITDKVDTKPTAGATNTPTSGKDTVADSTGKLPVEKTPLPVAITEVKDKVTEAAATPTLPAKFNGETEVAATTPTEKVETNSEVLPAESQAKVETNSEVLPAESQAKVETNPKVLPAESLTKVETKSEVLPAETKAKEESNPALLTDVHTTEPIKVVVAANPIESVKEILPTRAVESKETAEDKQPSLPLTETEKAEISTVTLAESSVYSTVKESQPTATVESQETAEVKPSLPLQETDWEILELTTANKSEESQTKEIIAETPAVSDVVIPKESLPSWPIVDESTEDDSATVENPQPSIDVFPTGSEVDYSISANLIARLESMKQSLTNLGSADEPGGNSSNETLIARLESVTQKLMIFNESTTVSDKIVALVDRLEETVDRLTIPPIQPPLPSIETAQFDFSAADQPIIGVIDTGFAGNNPDIDYSRITWGQDRVDGDADSRLEPGKGNEHGTHVLGIIAATQNNGVGIDGINEKAPIWAGRAIGSGKWADSLVEYVDFVKASGTKNAVINLSMDLTQVNPDGTTTTRYEFTPEERSAIEYARQNGVLMVVAAGNDGGVMSVLGQASQEFDNIITVGAADRVNDEIALSKAYDSTNYSSYGQGLDILAPGGTVQHPELSTVGDGVGTMAGTSVATAKVTGAVSQVWAANPSLSYRQVIQIIKDTATDLKTPNWDGETGAGVVNLEAAVALALATIPQEYDVSAMLVPETWSGEGKVTPSERAAASPLWPTVESANFSAWVMPTNGANVRSGPGTNFAIVSVSPYQATIQFDGWTYGERIPDEQLGTPDERWYRIAGTNNWMASAVVFGNAPGSTPLPPVQAPPQPLPPALLPGQGKVPANAGSFIKTVVSNQVTTHYYQNGYLMVQPNGQQSWYALGSSALPLLPVPVPKPVTVLPSPHGSTGGWQVQFWNNKNLSGNPTFTRAEPPGELRFSAGGVPSGTIGIPADGFSARWETTSNFEGGFYNFISQADDGVRVYIDGVKVVDKWKDQAAARNDAFVAVPKGQHKIVVEYFENAGNAVNNLRWEASNILKNWTGELRPVGYDGGAVHDTYLNSYQRNGGISKLGYPINKVHPWTQGYTQDFEGGSDGKGAIMKSNANDNSYWVGNDFWTTLLATGGADGILKYPTSDRYFTKSGQRQNFQGGAILKSKNGTFPIFGGMAGKYFELGAENSFLGFPTSGEIGLGDGWIIQNFERGYILYKEGMPTIAYNTKAIESLPPDSGHGSTSDWHGQYWNNKNLVGSPQWSQYEQKGELRFAAGEGGPPNTRGIKEDNFGARWITTSYFDGGIYNFINQADDGVRVYVDGKLTIDKWKDSAFEKKTAFAAIEPGYHQVMVEYFENGSAAANTLKWEQANPPKEWAGEFYRGKDLNDNNFAGNRGGGTSFLDKDWGNSHEAGVPIGDDDFSDRWATTRYFDSPGIYKFTSQADDGVRVWVDDKLVIDKWGNQPFVSNEVLISLDKGHHRIRVEHFENAGIAANKLSWQKLRFLPILGPGVIGLVQQEPWVAEYFNNRDLSGAPVVTRADRSATPGLSLNWGEGSPDSRIQRDNFSSRLTTHRQLPAGTYKFKLQADDGARLYINGEKVIDRWNNPPFNGHEVEITLPAGLHTLQVEHSEDVAPAYLNLDWDYSPNSPNYPIDPALQSAYNSFATQLGTSAIGVAITQLPPNPLSNKIQEFRGTLGRGALLKKSGSSTVSYVFGKLWEAYQKAGGSNALGYPLSSQKDLGNGAYELDLPNGKLFWAPGMTNPTYYEYFNNRLTIPADSWRGEYFNNRDWAGSPAMVRGDSASASNLDKQWVLGSPGPGVQADNFSVRWTTNRPFDRGTYRFVGNHDDGFKVEVNGQAPIDKMIEVATQTTGYGTFTQPGQYPVQLKYREYGGGATAQLRMEKASDFVVGLEANNNQSIELPDAFNKHGGYDRVGVPTNNVHLWGNGYVQDFDGGANGWGILMRRHNTTVFYYVSGKIWEAYRNTDNGAPGWLGYPTSDPFQEGGVTRQNFEGGYITFNGQTATVHRPTPPVEPKPGSGGGSGNSPVNLAGLQKLLYGSVSATVTAHYGFKNCDIWGSVHPDCTHPGIDFAATGQSLRKNPPIYSPVEGVVTGIDSAHGLVYLYNQKSNITFRFLHMKSRNVSTGQTVSKGQQVGTEGRLGYATGDHLHFDARPGWHNKGFPHYSQSINPVDAVNRANS
ncbi:PA14 domain-containing protein [Microcoleus sp. T3_D1]|uniref:PA14 domain-containing protein n=2 Tax=unclassified Microcoleus TaxID=2642155 RepID=UPI002FD45C7A